MTTGIALAMVLLITVAISGLIAAMVIIGTGALRSSTGHAKFDQSLAAAEAGIDSMLSELQADQALHQRGLGALVVGDHAADRGGGAGLGPRCDPGPGLAPLSRTPASGSTSRSSRPAGTSSTRWAGPRARPPPNATARLIKAEYLFAPYKPGNAILTSGNLSFSSSVTVDVSTGFVDAKANVHTNGEVDGTGCSQTVNGTVTSSGAYGVCGSVGDTGSGGGFPLEDVPAVDPRFVYDTFASVYADPSSARTSSGTTCATTARSGVQRPGSDPCSGDELADVSRRRHLPRLVVRGRVRHDGADLDHGVDLVGPRHLLRLPLRRGDGPQHDRRPATVIAEGAPPAARPSRCGMKGGKITAKLVGIQAAALPGIVFMADDDLEVTSNFEGGIGLFGARNQVKLETSSNGITGTVIANDNCTAGGDLNEVKNAVINYDRNVEVPLLDMIRTTQWLELKSGA